MVARVTVFGDCSYMQYNFLRRRVTRIVVCRYQRESDGTAAYLTKKGLFTLVLLPGASPTCYLYAHSTPDQSITPNFTPRTDGRSLLDLDS